MGVKNEFIYLDNKLLVNARSAPATKIRWRACAFGPWSGAVFDQFQASSTTDGVDIFRVGGGEGDHEMVSIWISWLARRSGSFMITRVLIKAQKIEKDVNLRKILFSVLKALVRRVYFCVAVLQPRTKKNSRIYWLSFKGRGLRERRNAKTWAQKWLKSILNSSFSFGFSRQIQLWHRKLSICSRNTSKSAKTKQKRTGNWTMW